MRVDAINKVSQLYQSSSVKKNSKLDKAGQSDLFEMSQTAKDYKVAKQAVASSSDIREDKVNDIKNRITTGTYNISVEEAASKIVENYFNKLV